MKSIDALSHEEAVKFFFTNKKAINSCYQKMKETNIDYYQQSLNKYILFFTLGLLISVSFIKKDQIIKSIKETFRCASTTMSENLVSKDGFTLSKETSSPKRVSFNERNNEVYSSSQDEEFGSGGDDDDLSDFEY